MRNVKKYCEHDVKNSLLKNINEFSRDLKDSSVLYNKTTAISNNAMNFINTTFDVKSNEVKKIIDHEILNLENYSKGLGCDLLEILIGYLTKNSTNIFRYDKKNVEFVLKKYLSSFDKNIKNTSKIDIDYFTSNIESENIKKIMEIVFNECDIEDQIYVENHNSVDTLVKRSNDLFFNIEYDLDFLLGKDNWEARDYRYIIIDGFIDKISEIHHLLYEASENKEPYVIFCKGMHEEVKHTIIKNNMRKTINVMPISFSTNEESINILNDIASCHNGEIISALKGDIISVEVRRDLSKGKKIKIHKGGFYIECIDEKRKNRQLNYLVKRIKNATPNDPNIDYLKLRSKNLNSKKVTLYLSTHISKKEKIDLDGCLRKINLMRSGITYRNGKVYTKNEIVIIVERARSFLKTISSLSNVIVLEEHNE